MNQIKNKFALVIITFSLLFNLVACGSSVQYDEGVETFMFTDDAGREVELPEEITRVAPSGAVATMMLAILCPEYMVCVSGTPSGSQYKYLPPNLIDLPTTGQLYGSRSTINMESLIDAEPQMIIDLGDRKDNIGADMDRLQKTTGIATIYLEADLLHVAEAFRSLGEILGLEERAEELASFLDETMEMAANNSQKIPDSQKKSVMFTSGTTGLNTNPAGSVQAQVLELVGAKNAIVTEMVSNAAGGNPISVEQLYNFDPDVIIFSPASLYDMVSGMEAWAGLAAVKNKTYYEIPSQPYNWVANPPSINMSIGIWWLGNLLYPDLYDYDVVAALQRIYELFWGYTLTEEEARDMLSRSTLAS